MTSDAHSSYAEAIGIKTLGVTDDSTGIVAVELGDSSTRSIKVMKIDYYEDEEKIKFTQNPKILYQSKAAHGTSEYREIGLSDDDYEDEDNNDP